MYEVLRINDLKNAEQLLIDHNKEIGRDLKEEELIAGVNKFLTKGEVLGFVENDHVLAMLNLYCYMYETLEAYICNVYVLEEYRGRHFAEKMMRKAIEICKNKRFKSIHLHVSESNAPAVALYKKLGFFFTDGYREMDREMVLIIEDNATNKKLMILGAGGAQLNLIKESKALGYTTIVCDMRPEMEGSKLADKYYQIDYMDLDGVYTIAVQESIDGIISNSEPAMINVAYISQKLNLIGNSVETIESLVSKSEFRNIQRKAGVFAPDHYVVRSYKELLEKAQIIQYPIIIKPTESCGTQGTTRIDAYDEEIIINTYDLCKEYSRNDFVSIEQYIPMSCLRVNDIDVVVIGDDIIWDGWLWEDRSKDTPMLPETEIFPMALPENKKEKIKNVIEKIIKTAGIRHGEYNVETYFTDKDEVFVIEMNPRQAGNYIPQLIEQHTGVNLCKLLVSTSVGDMTYFNELKSFERECNYVTLQVVFAKECGILSDIFISPEIKPYIKWIDQIIQIGDEIIEGANAFDAIAFIDMQFDTYERQHYFTDDIEKYIYPIVE